MLQRCFTYDIGGLKATEREVILQAFPLYENMLKLNWLYELICGTEHLTKYY